MSNSKQADSHKLILIKWISAQSNNADKKKGNPLIPNLRLLNPTSVQINQY